MIPILDNAAKIIAFGGRVIENGNPKYINSPETNLFQKGKQLFGVTNAKKLLNEKRLIICEGYMDVISLYQKNIKSVVAPLGTAFTEEQLKLSWRYTDRPTIMFDCDEA